MQPSVLLGAYLNGFIFSVVLQPAGRFLQNTWFQCYLFSKCFYCVYLFPLMSDCCCSWSERSLCVHANTSTIPWTAQNLHNGTIVHLHDMYMHVDFVQSMDCGCVYSCIHTVLVLLYFYATQFWGIYPMLLSEYISLQTYHLCCILSDLLSTALL